MIRDERCSTRIPSWEEERLDPAPNSFEEEERDVHSPTTFGEGERWKRPSPIEAEAQLQRQGSREEGEQILRLERPMTAEGELLNCRPKKCEEEGRRPSGRVQREEK